MSYARTPATQRPTTIDLAWAAGFLEGEGSFIYSRSARTTANQVDREPLERLHQIFGGSLKQFYPPSSRGKHQPIWIWAVNGAQGAAVAMTLYPLMSARRQEAIRKMLAHWRAQPGRGTAMVASNRARTQCKNGHPYTPETMRLVPYTKGQYSGDRRQCLICYRAKMRADNQRSYWKNPEKYRAYARAAYDKKRINLT